LSKTVAAADASLIIVSNYFKIYGIIEIEKLSTIGLIVSIVLGIGGIIPFLVHKIFVKSKNHFNISISNAVIYLNILSGLTLIYLSVSYFA